MELLVFDLPCISGSDNDVCEIHACVLTVVCLVFVLLLGAAVLLCPVHLICLLRDLMLYYCSHAVDYCCY